MTSERLVELTAEAFPALLDRMADAKQCPENMDKLGELWRGFLGRMFTVTYPGSNDMVTKTGILLGVTEIDNHGYGLQFLFPKGKRGGSYRKPKIPAYSIRDLELQ